MSDWGITTKVPAEIVLAEGVVLAGDLHLYARPTYPPGPETRLEMLIPKTQVVVVSCRNQATLADPDRVSAALKAKRYDVSFLGEG